MKSPPDDLADRLMAISADLLEPDAEIRFEHVADRVGVARTTLYYYFSGRDDLIGFLLAQHLAEGGRAVAEATADRTLSATDRLRAVLNTMLEFLSAEPGMCGALLSTMARGSGIAEVMLANQQHVAGPLHELLVEGQSTGEFVGTDPADATDALMGALLITVLGRASRGAIMDPAGFGPPPIQQLVGGLQART